MEKDFADRLNSIEKKWQKKWEEEEIHRAEKDEEKQKCYVLDMFPYTSGKMHMGHARAFSLGDAFSRFKSMQGFNVMHPMGWDAFGMPAENAAIDRDVDPEEWTMDCISDMKEEFKRLGFSLDWDRELATCDSDYYRWDQWIFLKMLEEDIAYRDEAAVNWCPSCETVLADEQVEEGLCWRCDSEVDQNKKMEQWKLAITDYADELLEDLEQLDGWPDKVRQMQENWIGKSRGAEIEFPLKKGGKLDVFTTRPDTIFGATFMALAPEHELAEKIAEEKEEVAEYIENAKQKDDEQREEKSKSGIFTERYAENPFTGEEIPIYVAEFVLPDYGTGAIMAVPAHDQRDFEFAKEHDIEVRKVVEPDDKHDFSEEAYEGDGKHIDSEFLNGLNKEEAIEKTIDELADRGLGREEFNYKLRDWLISRQRYWGTPIPVLYCDDCGTVPVEEDNLPVKLPNDVEFTGEGNPIETSKEFLRTECPECGSEARRETDTMDTFFNSSWYFLRYCSPDFEEAPFDSEESNYWMNVDQYVGGVEHAVMHLLYARFFQKFLRDQGMVEQNEPFEKLLTQGMVNHPAYECPEHGWIYPEEVEDENTCSKCGREVEVETIKMSKSKNNVVRPSELVEEYGADTARLFILRASHPSKELDWSKDGVKSSHRMLRRIEKLLEENKDLPDMEPGLEQSGLEDRIVSSRIQRTIEKVTKHNENYEFNLAVGEIDKLLTKLYWYKERDPEPSILKTGIKTLIKLVAPFSPHIADEMWERLGEDGFLYESSWPEVKEEQLDREAEKIDEYFDRVAKDIREIKDMLDSEPDTIKVIQSADWKYEAFRQISENLDLDSVGDITGKVVGSGFKDQAEQVNRKVREAFENPGRFKDQLMEKEAESKALKANKERWAEEFNVDVVIEKEEKSEEGKASRAEPGKPAIVME